MVKCCVSKCSSRTQKGVIFKSFPKEPELREQWKLSIGRVNWEPTQYSVVCEKHFASNMWEKPRADGKRKLKRSACPTLFHPGINENNTTLEEESSFYTLHIHVSNDAVSEESSDETELNDISDEVEQDSINTGILHNDNVSLDTITSSELDNKLPLPDVLNSSAENKSEYPVDWEKRCKEFEVMNKILKEKLKKVDQTFKQRLCLQNALKRNNEVLRKRLSRFKKGNNHTLEVAIKNFFNDDQLHVLMNGSLEDNEWSVETLSKALKLREACGSRGYHELQKQNIPLPSEETLQQIQYL